MSPREVRIIMGTVLFIGENYGQRPNYLYTLDVVIKRSGRPKKKLPEKQYK
jgi:hypothetical protein